MVYNLRRSLYMDEYFLLITLFGTAVFTMAWMPAISKITRVSYAIIYVLAGVIIYSFFPHALPAPNPVLHDDFTLHITEIVVIISLMGTGIKLDRKFSFKNWSSPIKLISITMLLCIASATLLGYSFLGLDLASAVLLGAVLAPTDPVLASDVQVEPPNEGEKSETKFILTAEAGLNDGMAFPFTWLAITLAILESGKKSSLLNWFAYDFLFKILVGVLIGFIVGKLVGYLVFRVSEKYDSLKTRDGFLAISLTFMVYGITELLHGYGFIAVFICAITFRHSEKNHDYHDSLHSFTDQTERLLIAILLILFGGSLATGILDALSWGMALFSLGFVFIIRPLAAYLSLINSKIHFKEKMAVSFFGIRGMGSVFYLAFAFKEVHFYKEKELWAIIAFTILLSVVIHGVTASPIMDYLSKNKEIKQSEAY